MRYLINLKYNGSMFYGYQIQKNKETVEGEIERVLSKILNEKINTIASSRTDRGVHALNQYCHFDYDKNINVKKLTHSMNSMINDGIYIKSIKKVNDDFHARYNVLKKEYIYKIKSFTSDKDNNNYERDIIVDYKISNKVLYLRFYSSGFLRYMIRNIVGLLLEINDGKKTLDDIKYIFDSKDRCSLGKCVDGCGLYLNKVEY